MSGRGRELTLPSWMTSEAGPQMSAPVPVVPVVAQVAPVVAPVAPAIVAPIMTAIPAAPQPPVFMAKPVTHLAPTLSMPIPTMPSLFPTMAMGGMFPGGAATAATSVSDPNNDVSCWSEFLGEGGRKYWHNRVTGMGTYDKPFCLKSPEERSIPPCAWKEYVSGDKKYYSNGTESTWDMPEEFRVWKEKMDAVEAKKVAQAAAAKAAQNFGLGPSTVDKSANSTKVILPTVTYATAAEAQEAFRQLLVDKKITSTQKVKDVIDICQFDARWNALKSLGEKKQSIAEFQTKLLKLEKEEQKVKARKNRDAFLLMLAENTEIDARTRWRDAVTILQEDQRFKNVEDAREREDLFKDFILELEKKEREDSKKLRADAIVAFHEILEQMYRDNKFGRLSIWGESRSLFSEVILQPRFKSMTDADFRICFQDFVSTLAEAHRQQERKRREEYLSALEARKKDFGSALEALVNAGVFNVNSRWSAVSLLSEVTSLPAYKELIRHVDERPSDLQIPADLTGLNECRDVFDACLLRLQDQHKADKRAVKDLMHLMKVKISHDSKFEDLKALVTSFIGSPRTTASSSISSVRPEDGEEVDDNAAPAAGKASGRSSSGAVPSSSSSTVAQPSQGGSLEGHLKALITDRPSSLLTVFNEYKERAFQDHEEDLRQQQKAERKFISLLEETFYLSDHVGLQWEEAKKTLQKRSAYDVVGKSDRKRLFAEYMTGLSAKLEAKTKSIKSLASSSAGSTAVNETSAVVGDGNPEKDLVRDNKSHHQSHSESATHSTSHSKRDRSYSGGGADDSDKRRRH